MIAEATEEPQRLWSKKNKPSPADNRVSVVAPLYRGIACRIIGRTEVNLKRVAIEISYDEKGKMEFVDWKWSVGYVGMPRQITGIGKNQDHCKSQIIQVLDKMAHGLEIPRHGIKWKDAA